MIPQNISAMLSYCKEKAIWNNCSFLHEKPIFYSYYIIRNLYINMCILCIYRIFIEFSFRSINQKISFHRNIYLISTLIIYFCITSQQLSTSIFTLFMHSPKNLKLIFNYIRVGCFQECYNLIVDRHCHREAKPKLAFRQCAQSKS